MTATAMNFPHRRNQDGEYESICRTCFATVATAKNEAELLTFEKAHTCDAMQLYYTSQGYHPNSMSR
jgi:hypothetical protein